MGFRYYTTVTFPVAAMQIDEVKQAAAGFKDTWSRSIEDDGAASGTVVVSDGEANYGNMSDITDVLNEFEVPHNVYHSESEGSRSIPWTEYVRFDDTSIELSEVQEESALFAKSVLELIDKGDLDAATNLLRKEAENVPPAMPDEWEPDPAVIDLAREDRAPEEKAP
jgi:hypothetical protein